MHKLSFVTLGLVLVAHLLSAQKPVVKIGPELKLPKDKVFQDHLYSDPSGAHYLYYYDYTGGYSLFGSPRISKLVLEKHDSNLKLEFAKEFEIKGKNHATLGVNYFQGKFAWLLSDENKSEDYIKYYINPISLTGKSGERVDIAKIKYESSREIPQISWTVSKDSSKLLVNAVRDSDVKGNKVNIFSFVLDKDYTKLWSKKINLPYTEKQVNILSTLVANDGSVYMLAKVYEDQSRKESKKEKSKSVPAYDVILFRIDKDHADPQEIKLDLGNAFIQGATLAADVQGNIDCAGFFSKIKYGSIQGVFFMKLLPDGTVVTTNKKEFTESDLDIVGKRNTEKDRGGEEGLDNSFKFSDFLVRDDGSAVVIAEQNYSVTYTNYNGRTYTTYTTYYSNDIIFFSVSASGNVEKVTMIPKRQASGTSFFQSYSTMIRDQDVTFFYNEREANLDKPIVNPRPRVANDFNGSIAVMTTLDVNGDLTRKQLFDADDVESLFVPKNSRQVSKNQLFFVTQKFRLFGSSRFRIGTVTRS